MGTTRTISGDVGEEIRQAHIPVFGYCLVSVVTAFTRAIPAFDFNAGRSVGEMQETGRVGHVECCSK